MANYKSLNEAIQAANRMNKAEGRPEYTMGEVATGPGYAPRWYGYQEAFSDPDTLADPVFGVAMNSYNPPSGVDKFLRQAIPPATIAAMALMGAKGLAPTPGAGGAGITNAGNIGGVGGNISSLTPSYAGNIGGIGGYGSAALTPSQVALQTGAPSVIGSTMGATGPEAAGGWMGKTLGTVGNLLSSPWAKVAGLVGANYFGSSGQADMLGDLNTANQASYDQYLNAINPPASVLNARYNQLAGNIREGASQARRRISDTLAARGIRGRGVASPIAAFETDVVQPELNKAYNQIYGQFNVPATPGPANFSPSTGQLFKTNLAQTGAYLLPSLLQKQLWGNA